MPENASTLKKQEGVFVTLEKVPIKKRLSTLQRCGWQCWLQGVRAHRVTNQPCKALTGTFHSYPPEKPTHRHIFYPASAFQSSTATPEPETLSLCWNELKLHHFFRVWFKITQKKKLKCSNQTIIAVTWLVQEHRYSRNPEVKVEISLAQFPARIPISCAFVQLGWAVPDIPQVSKQCWTVRAQGWELCGDKTQQSSPKIQPILTVSSCSRSFWIVQRSCKPFASVKSKGCPLLHSVVFGFEILICRFHEMLLIHDGWELDLQEHILFFLFISMCVYLKIETLPMCFNGIWILNQS